MSLRPLFVLSAIALFPLACTSLTTPPEPQDIAAESPSAGAAAAAAGSSGPGQVASIRNPHAPAPPDTPAAPEGKLEVAETAAGKGAPAKAGDMVSVNYVGKLTDGTVFDQSKGKPFSFPLGAGKVIKGWDQGLLGMKPGSKRKLTIPPSLAYGARGFPPVIPPNSTLVFDVEMLDIKPGADAPQRH